MVMFPMWNFEVYNGGVHIRYSLNYNEGFQDVLEHSSAQSLTEMPETG